ncbi:MAG: succinate dehydrogenase, cytochrome b556 subunit [Gammaproteobacteria bacterium]
MTPDSRPLSPHLQIYRLPLTVILSISHRTTGALLGFGAFVFVLLVAAAAAGPDAYAGVHSHLAAWYGQLLTFAFTFALFFHFCNGIRHLAWDIGYGFDYATTHNTAVIALIASAGLTLLLWIVVIATRWSS